MPNKEFIAARVLNWSLSDQATRVVILVGVAYEVDFEKSHEIPLIASRQLEVKSCRMIACC